MKKTVVFTKEQIAEKLIVCANRYGIDPGITNLFLIGNLRTGEIEIIDYMRRWAEMKEKEEYVEILELEFGAEFAEYSWEYDVYIPAQEGIKEVVREHGLEDMEFIYDDGTFDYHDATIINLTPQTVNIMNTDGQIIRSFESQGNALVQTSSISKGHINDIPVFQTEYKETLGLPEEMENTFYIVSVFTKQYNPSRKDLLIVSQLQRNEKGQPIGCLGLE